MLLVWALVLVAALGGLALLLRAVMKGAGTAVGRTTYERHTAAEEITTTGAPPAAWRAGQDGPPWSAQAGKEFLRRLDDLIRYFERADVFDTEETRRLLLEDLGAARERWARGDWEATRPS